MAIETDSDRDEFFDPDEFADVAIVVGTGGRYPVLFHYRADDAELKRGGTQSQSMAVELRYPRFVVKTGYAEEMLEGQAVKIRGQLFNIVSLHPDGTGLTHAELVDHQDESGTDEESVWR